LIFFFFYFLVSGRPYRLRIEETNVGNSQLPTKSDGFMVTGKLFESIHSNLHPTRGRMLLQSNCEDVAVFMRNLAVQTKFDVINDAKNDVSSRPRKNNESNIVQLSQQQRIPQRTANYVAIGGERARGQGWLQNRILPDESVTETEIACVINGTPIHRCLLKKSTEQMID
tara:strand:- start:83 stop:592 length:510 start_codon:yes stop_codon:yes gene_type:complete